MNIELEYYIKQNSLWPKEGRFILAQYDKQSVIVYQAYKPSIAKFALQHGYFGGNFKFTRMSWIKPNFLWMMYRSGWGTKKGQEYTLAIRLDRSFFTSCLEKVVSSTYDPKIYSDVHSWKNDVTKSSVRIQWDPDHDPSGVPLKRRAIQLGLRGEALKEYAKRAIIEIIDLSDFVRSQRQHLKVKPYSNLKTPREEVFVPKSQQIYRKLGLSIVK